MNGEGGPLAASGHMPFHGHRTCAEPDKRWCAECKQLRAEPCRYSLCALAKALGGGHVADLRPVAVVRWTDDGEMQLGIFGDGVRMLVIDERSPHDRLFEITHREPLRALDALVPAGSEIGHRDDDRHDAMVERMRSLFEGKPHLTAVPSGGTA
jgi:hypothetical protein